MKLLRGWLSLLHITRNKIHSGMKSTGNNSLCVGDRSYHLLYSTVRNIRTEWQNATLNPLTPTVAIWVQPHPVPDRVKPSFVIFDIRAL